MKFLIATLALASTVVAQELGALPDCAKNCLAEFTTGNQIGDCARLDAKCICASSTFISGIACCLAGVCDASDQQQATNFALSFCSTQGVTDLPHSVTCATSSTAATEGSSSSTSSSSASVVASTTTTMTTGTGTGTGTGTETSSATTSSTATVMPNAAWGLGGSANVYGGLLAALALL
ncbi:hypothetical protein GGR50DRAFT_197611 [Xylaria sp. CBS 124048]|nr:hypothetical protein GGR50DRAFT_197611 [Xylaria sp. CBS 124048]